MNDELEELYDSKPYEIIDNKPKRPGAKRKKPVKPGSKKNTSLARKEVLNIGTNDGHNSAVVQHTLKIAALGKFNYRDPDLLLERLNTYYNICIEDDIKPTVASTALALGMSRSQYNEILHGSYKSISGEILDIFKLSYRMLTAQMEIFMQEGYINPVSGIFLMRNNMEYRNDVEMTVNVTANNDLQTMSNKDIIEQARLIAQNESPTINAQFEENKDGDKKDDQD